MESKLSTRRFDLDWLRVLAILMVFVAHCGRLFDAEDWHVKNAVTYPGLGIVAGAVLAWLMPLIFLISGAATFYSLRKGAARFVMDRVRRLLVPLIVGIFTHIMLGVYLEQVTHHRFYGSFLEFVPHYFDGLLGYGGNFAWMGLHLWYLEWLFVYSLVSLPLFLWLAAGSGRRLLDRLGALLARPLGVYLLALPGTLLIPFLNPDNAFLGFRGWGGWGLPTYIFFFLAGFVIIAHDGIQERVRRQRHASLAAGVLLLVVVGVLMAGGGEPRFGTPRYALVYALYSLASWCLVLAILGFGRQHLTAPRPILRYANEAVLPFYILHQTVILGIGYYVVQWSIPDLLKYVVTLSGSFVVTMALYEFAIRRVNVLRFLFGMKLLPKKAALGSAERPVASSQA
jgi:peptidoglycan/LPS O-acetylase OafA/YrhL